MLGRYTGWFSKTAAFAVAAFLLLPITIIIPVSFTDQRFLSLPKDEFSTKNYAQLFSNEIWISAAGQSLLIAVLATLIAVTAGTLCAIGCWRIARKSTNLIRVLMLLPLVIPTVVYAVGLYRYFAMLGILDTIGGVVLAHAVTGIPYVIITVSGALAMFDPRLESAARGLGASFSQTLRLVIIPRILPGILSGAILVFIHSWDELVIVLFISSRRVFTLPREIWDGVNENVDPTIAAVAVILIAITIVLLLVDLAFRRKAGS